MQNTLSIVGIILYKYFERVDQRLNLEKALPLITYERWTVSLGSGYIKVVILVATGEFYSFSLFMKSQGRTGLSLLAGLYINRNSENRKW